jgi:predicted Zn-dependent protease
MADFIAMTIPERWEARVFAGALSGEIEPTPEFERAQAIFDRLLEYEDLRPLPYRLFLIDLGGPNAVAVPGGSVGVTPELLDRVRTETGLAVVLGHELGHHQGRHSLKKMGRGLLLGTVRSLLFGGDVNRLIKVSLSVAESGHSRRHENEADDFGMRMVHDIYGHADDALEFFELILMQSDQDQSTWESFIASHPLTSERIDRLRDLRDRLDRGKPSLPNGDR